MSNTVASSHRRWILNGKIVSGQQHFAQVLGTLLCWWVQESECSKKVNAYLYVCAYLCAFRMHADMHIHKICIDIYLCTCIYMHVLYVCGYTHTHTQSHTHPHEQTYFYLLTHQPIDVCVCVCTYTYVYIHICVYMYLYICTVFAHVFECVRTYVRMHVYMCVYIYVFTYTHAQIHIQVRNT